MITYVIRRILYSIPVLVITSFLIFWFVTASGDPLNEVRRLPKVSQHTIDLLIERKHLDEPLVVQYGYWVKDAVTNQFGTSLTGDQPIFPDIRRVMGNTIQLVIIAEILAVFIAIGIGVVSATRQYSWFDYTTTTFSFIGFSTPIFWLALILQVIFTNLYLDTGVRIFFVGGLSSPDPDIFWLDRLQHLAIPIICIATISIAQYSRYMRASMLEVINSDYVRTARAKGLMERKVLMKHAFRNGLIPLVTVVTLNFGVAFGGAIVTESIFSLDGMGFYFINKLGQRDVYPLMAWLMITSTLVILFNLTADILYGYLDPRIRYD